MTHQIFSYGTLAIPHVMDALTGSIPPTVPAHVTSYASFLLKGKPYPGMCRREGVVTSGLLYLNVDEKSLRVIDAFEDDIYVRESIGVMMESGALTNAWAYLVLEEYEERLGVECWDQDVFLDKHGESYIAMCARVHDDFFHKQGWKV
ncbi:MAG: hypothetical protein CMH81_02830 [Nitrospiraceae bacterium]|nr:hypothetical protein [Nitrospiraceae bacterium]